MKERFSGKLRRFWDKLWRWSPCLVCGERNVPIKEPHWKREPRIWVEGTPPTCWSCIERIRKGAPGNE
jgi:hypothetical protein